MATTTSSDPSPDLAAGSPSLLVGPSDTPLWTTTLGTLIETQAEHYGTRNAIVFPAQNVRRTYTELLQRSKLLAKALLAAGIQPGDCIGIFAGNCYEYLEVFLGGARIGSPVVVLNTAYTPAELLSAVAVVECKILFATQVLGPDRDISEHLDMIRLRSRIVQSLVMFSGSNDCSSSVQVLHYTEFTAVVETCGISDLVLATTELNVRPNDILNLQFTSGTTGAPKAAMLTHFNLINDGRLVGLQLRLKPDDVVCCPPPLFHCFGLVMGFLASFTNGSSIVFPSPVYNASKTLDAIEAERCTVLLGVPTMFWAELDENQKRRRKVHTLRVGLAAGAPVPKPLMSRVEKEMGVKTILNMYGMTETSPVTFATSLNDTLNRRLFTIGTVFPHTGAKIVDQDGNIVPRGVRGEICTCGFALQRGYWKNEEKTKEAMRRDSEGVLWMHTGDEGAIDADGYCRITGRIKDMIIRGGENIFPAEIEERLVDHASICEASVVGVQDDRYGEVVGCFLRQTECTVRPTGQEVSKFVRETLGRHKAPQHVFWVGDEDVGEDYPKTGSGKHKKHVLRDIAARILRSRGAEPARPKL